MIQLNVEATGGQDFSVTIDRDVTIGRSKSCEVHIPLRTFSGHHLTVQRTPAGFVVLDAGSTNGTLRNGKLLTPYEPLLITDVTVLQVVDVRLTFQPVASHTAQFTLEDSESLARDLLASALANQGVADVSYLECNGHKIAVGDGAFFDQNFAPVGEHGAAFAIQKQGDGFILIPRVPLTVNNEQVAAPAKVENRSVIRTNVAKATFYDPVEEFIAELDVSEKPVEPIPTYDAIQSAPVTAEPVVANTGVTEPAAKQKRGWSALEWGMFAFAILVFFGAVAAVAALFLL